MRSLFLSLLILAMQFVPGFAQHVDSVEPRNGSYDLWLVRSQTITADLIKDSTNLSPLERALLWARLAQRWWQDDPERARSWMLKSIEIVKAIPNKENPEERRLRLSTVRSLLQLVAPLDQKLSARLVTILKQDAEQEGATEGAANADGLVQAATLLVENNPKRAAELGMLALLIGPPTDIASLFWKLRRKDPKLANVLFAQALAKARETPDSSFLFSLVTSIFPEYFTPGFNAKLESTDSMRREILKAYLGHLQANRSQAEHRNIQCMQAISIAPLVTEFDRLLPHQAIIARQFINQCQSLSPLGKQRVDDALREKPLETVAELLKAAEDAQDLKVRTVYQFRAATLAVQQNDHEQALKILDTMSVESRVFMGGVWESVRWTWAATAALRHLAAGDVAAMRLVINAVPGDLQSFAKIAFVDQLPADRNIDTDPTLEFLSDARTGLRRSSTSVADKPGWYFALLRLIVKYQAADAIVVLKEAATAINHADEAEAKTSTRTDRAWINGSGVFAAPLLELDDYAVSEAVSSISSTDTRIQVRLELLRVCLDQLKSSKQAAPKPKKLRS